MVTRYHHWLLMSLLIYDPYDYSWEIPDQYVGIVSKHNYMINSDILGTVHNFVFVYLLRTNACVVGDMIQLKFKIPSNILNMLLAR